MKNILLLFCILYTTGCFAQNNTLTDSIPYPLIPSYKVDTTQAPGNKIVFEDTLQSNIGKQYMDFNIITLENEVITEKSLLGKVTLLYCWFDGCTPCNASFPEINNLYLKFSKHPDFQFISLARGETDIIQNAKSKYNLLFPICPVSWDEAYRLNFKHGFPVYIITDKNGKVTYLKGGGFVQKDKIKKDMDLLEQKIEKILALQ